MASSGSFNTNTVSGAYLKFSWSIKSQSIANNQSVISWNLKGVVDYGYVMAGAFKVTIAGTTVYSSATRIQLWNGTTVASGEFTLTHDSVGNKSFTAYAEAGIYTYDVSSTGSGTWSLTQIPRQATITTATNFTDIENPTITYSNPAGNNVTSLQACIANTAGNVVYVQYRDISKTGTSYTFELTEEERNVLRQATTNSKTMNVNFFVKTVIGGNTLYSYLGKTLTIVNANPTFDTSYLDTNSTTTNITQNNQQIIRNNSTLQINISNAAALKYATLSSASVVINGVTYSTSTFSSGSATINVGTINVANNITAPVTLTDSRGYTTTINLNLIILDWVLPTGIITCQRKNNYYTETDILVDGSCSSLDSKNVMTIQYQYKKTTESSYSALATLQDNVVTTFNIDNIYAWNIRVIVSDLLGSTTYNLSVDKGIPVAFFDKHNSAGGFNRFPEAGDALAIQGNFRLGGTIINNNLFNQNTIIAGDITSSNPTTRLSSRQVLWLEAGTYTFSTNLTTTYNYALEVESQGIPPFSSWPTLDYDSGWLTDEDKTFTITSAGYFILALKKADGSTLSVADIIDYEYKLEKGNVATPFEPYQIIDASRISNMLPTILYENNSGSTGTITLSDDLSNYTYIEIYVKDNNGVGSNATKIFMPDGKNVGISLTEASDTLNNTYIRRTRYNLSGTSITPNITTAGYVLFNGSAVTSNSGTNYLQIIRVIGFKY